MQALELKKVPGIKCTCDIKLNCLVKNVPKHQNTAKEQCFIYLYMCAKVYCTLDEPSLISTSL